MLVPFRRTPLVGAAAVILAGGRSSRMGRCKALLPIGPHPMVMHVLESLRGLFDEIIVVAAPGQRLPPLPGRIVYDAVAQQGPLRGILEGLLAVAAPTAFVAPCDAAFLSQDLVAHLVSLIEGHDVVVPRWEGRDEPLHAVYRRQSVRPVLERLLERGRLRPVFAFDELRTMRVEEDEVRRFDPEGASFININTPADYAAALRRLGRGTVPAA